MSLANNILLMRLLLHLGRGLETADTASSPTIDRSDPGRVPPATSNHLLNCSGNHTTDDGPKSRSNAFS